VVLLRASVQREDKKTRVSRILNKQTKLPLLKSVWMRGISDVKEEKGHEEVRSSGKKRRLLIIGIR